MPADDLLNLCLIVLVLLLGALSHVLDILLLIKRHLERSTVSIHTLQDLPILHTCLEKGWIQRKVYALLHSLVLSERIHSMMLQIDQTAYIGSFA